jgi:hypothetical protein
MQAYRNGIATAIKHWLNRLSMQGAIGSSIEQMYKDAESGSNEDREKAMYPGCRDQPLACRYWRGRRQVDSNVLLKRNVRTEEPEKISAI